jgi:hypothetical protein
MYEVRAMRTAAICSAALLLPFLVLEIVNRGFLEADFPIVLFGILWLLPFVILLIVLPMVRQLRAERLVGRAALLAVFKGALVLGLASMWLLIVVDQMPCFLGVPNCD